MAGPAVVRFLRDVDEAEPLRVGSERRSDRRTSLAIHFKGAQAVTTIPDAELIYGDPCGVDPLRNTFAEYLGRARGVAADPTRVVVTSGYASRCGTLSIVRTTGNLADDVAVAVERHRRERSIGLSEALNDLVRAGLSRPRDSAPFRQQTHDLGDGIDVSNVADALETLDGPMSR